MKHIHLIGTITSVKKTRENQLCNIKQFASRDTCRMSLARFSKGNRPIREAQSNIQEQTDTVVIYPC